MATLTDDMKRVVEEQRLGFYATVNEDGTPNLSPKGTTAAGEASVEDLRVWDDDHLFFADIRSPRTVANIRRGSQVEVNLVDPFIRKGYRFRGPAVVYDRGTDGYNAGIERLREHGISTLLDRIRHIVVIAVHRAQPLISPAYDDGTETEADLVRRYRERFAELNARYDVPTT
jgi:hypothetical protein